MEFYESVQGYIATECPICGTRLILRPEQAGGTLKCEMCYHQMAIPKEIRIRPKQKTVQHQVEPYALREDEPPPEVAGEREPEPDATKALPAGRSDDAVLRSPKGPGSRAYDLIPSNDPPEQPKTEDRSAGLRPTSNPSTAPSPDRSPAEEPANPPRRRKQAFAVVCPKCNNRMYARLHQVGEQIACGDCGYVIVVPQPPAEAPQKVLPRPEPIPLSAEDLPTPPEGRAERPGDNLHSALGTPRTSWRPEPPRWTFFSGVVSFLWVGAGPLYWLVLSGGLLVTSVVGALVISWNGSITGGYGGIGAAMITLFLLAAFGPVLAWTLSYGACCFLAVMRDTANGADEIVEWPQLAFSERLGDLVRVVYHAGSTLALAYGFGVATGQSLSPAARVAVAAGAAMLLFPFLTISSLESHRVIWPFSAVVSRSLLRLWWGWLLMYLEIAVLLAIWAATVVFSIADSPYLTALWSSPILAAVALISARLFGRLIWRATAQDADDQPRKPTVYERVVRSGE